MKKGKVPTEASQVEEDDVIDLSLPGLDEDEGEDLDITPEPADNVLQTPHQQRPCFTGSAQHQVSDSGCQCCSWPLCYASLTLISCVDVQMIYRSLQLVHFIEGPLCVQVMLAAMAEPDPAPRGRKNAAKQKQAYTPTSRAKSQLPSLY